MNIDMDAVIDELRKGWRKGDYGPWALDEGAVCVLGAVRRVTGDSSHEFTAEVSALLAQAAREAFPGREIGNEVYDIANFNDHPATTVDDVVLVCEKARARMGEVA